VGLRQKGVLKSKNDTMLYFFRLSTEIIEDVEIRLQSENGQFKMIHMVDGAPKVNNYTSKGSEREAIKLRQAHSLTKNIQTHYIRVVPVVSESNIDTMAY
jgi:hypothetical protein